MKKMSETEIRELLEEFDEQAPPIEALSGYDRMDAWIEWLKVRLGCPTVEQLEVRIGMKILE